MGIGGAEAVNAEGFIKRHLICDIPITQLTLEFASFCKEMIKGAVDSPARSLQAYYFSCSAMVHSSESVDHDTPATAST